MILTVEVRKRESRGQRPFAKYNEKSIAVVVFCYNYTERYTYTEKEIHYWGNWNTTDRENAKTERKYTIGEIGT